MIENHSPMHGIGKLVQVELRGTIGLCTESLGLCNKITLSNRPVQVRHRLMHINNKLVHVISVLC